MTDSYSRKVSKRYAGETALLRLNVGRFQQFRHENDDHEDDLESIFEE